MPHFSLGFLVAPASSGGQAPQLIEAWTLLDWAVPGWAAVLAWAVLAAPDEQAAAAAAASAATQIRRAGRARGITLRSFAMARNVGFAPTATDPPAVDIPG